MSVQGSKSGAEPPRGDQAAAAQPAGQPAGGGQKSIFRLAALEYYRQGLQDEGDVLHISPHWARRAYWVLVALLAAGLFYGAVGTLREYVAGPALVRMDGRGDVMVGTSGVVASVEVQPGQRVQAGQLLVKLVPDEGPLAQELTAPFAGVVASLRVVPGQHVEAGARALSLFREDSRAYLMAFFPARARPFLRPGMSLRVELDGFRYHYQQMPVDSVESQVIGPAELGRYLGTELADAVSVEGPIVLVRARLPSSTFMSDGQVFSYVDGLPGRAEVLIRSEPILISFIPGLRRLLSHGG